MQKELLLKVYRNIWNNRLLEVDGKSAEEILHEAIKRELLDENSHPRIRKSKEDKFYLAVKRILDSSASQEEQLQLISLYTNMLESLRG